MIYTEYETIYVVKPELPEDALKALNEKIQGIINKNEEYQIVEKIVNGESVDESDELTLKLIKTWRVLNEETLYAHSYLEL